MNIPKFRAYIKETGNLAQVLVIDFERKCIWIKKPNSETGLKRILFDEIELMQYTGLKDINGTEIYKGDLLRFPAKNKYEEKTYNAFEVFWHDNDSCSNHIGWQMNRMHPQGNSAGGYCWGFRPEYTSKMKIIGNIHQNPELLQRENEVSE